MKKIINSPQAAAPIGPYNQAVWAGDILYISGQVALDASTGKLQQANIMAETEKAMLNLQAILEEADLTMEHLVKCSIFVLDMEQFSAINTAYGSFFREETAPARETVQVAALPKGARVEISAIAYQPSEEASGDENS